MLINSLLFILFLLIFIVPQSFAYAKGSFLVAPILMIIVNMFIRRGYGTSRLCFFYYSAFGLMTIVWALVGSLRGNPEQAIVESVRVYFLFMWIYYVIIIHLSKVKYHGYIDPVVCISSAGISFFCFYVLFDHLYGLSWFSETIKNSMYLEVGIHEGYVQMNNVNVGMFCFIVPYLTGRYISELSASRFKIGLCILISIIATVLASRRIVLVLLVLAPALTLLINKICRSCCARIRSRVIWFYIGLFVFAFSGALCLFYYDPNLFEGFSGRILDVFMKDPESVRQMQNVALLEGFSKYVFWGSGFGGMTEVVRSVERPWTYELTYSRVLFNMGIVGVFILFSFFSFYIYAVISKISESSHKNIYVPLMVGFFSVLIASASNPYLSSFDYIFSLSIIPLILSTIDVANNSFTTKYVL